VTLDELSKALGFSGKPTGMTGADVETYFRAGRIKEIAEYCETDVINAYRIWLRYELFCGRLSKSGYEASEDSLREFIQASAKPHLANTVRI
jgi:3'-5' exonuclease